ncbi:MULTISPECIES: NEL-type E3 ubiquitin ligase domain-containing protein [unclassified Pseudomonas]|uniref:NEL-type E3 ubiquitin ligase domain-containing protein n=1 Tax=unclassified Pseudomonas TaxID=196821 RepID=UPI000A09B7C9|nr:MULTISPECIES: NEL-type E3 ubiquitin ligase domain-containing protein [unclassified Pseudomonas]SMF40323.1 Leucine rich repeat-containing protein [Pseudomonas sp. LAIL14HWK12:I11]SMR79315.1 Leucine rich repeat-containing protein [Pseudomonas sp. LAIL14HWK12:I10]SOD05081.1 Leucine rich repeat-containing protein [Pseudomonas sp. LAIL14HWK12:I8]
MTLSADEAPASIDALISQRLPAWLTSATVDQQRALHQALRQQQDSAERVRQLFSHIPALDDFAAALLEDALRRRFKVSTDVRKATLRKVVQIILATPIPPTPSPNIVRISTQPLLTTALHNFTQAETKPGPFTQVALQDVAGVTLSVSFERFAKLCRTLDLGGRYQALLRVHLLPADRPGDEPGQARREVEALLEEALRSSMEAAVRLAALKGQISHDNYLQTLPIFAKPAVVPAYPVVLRARQVYLLGKCLHGVVAIEIQDRDQAYLRGILLWIPGDPQQPVQVFESWWAFYQAMGLRLRDPHYAAFMARFIAERDRVAFFGTLKRLLSSSAEGAVLQLDGRDFAITQPLFAFLRASRIDKMLDDARVLAVPTADEDSKARDERLRGYQQAGLTLLNLAGLFVPVVGELMLAVAAVQIADEVYEGYQDWQLGDRQGALEHVFSVAESVALGAAIGAGTAVAGHVLKRIVFVDELSPIRTDAGHVKLCAHDLSAYRVKEQGVTVGELIPEDDQWQLKLHEASFQLAGYKDGEHLFIRHPQRSEAFQPMLEHNGTGGWRHALERAEEWAEPARLMRRLSAELADVSDEDVRRVLDSTGFDDAQLRRLHLENAPPPARLLDALERYRLHEQFPTVQGEAFEFLVSTAQGNEELASVALRRDFPGLSHRGAHEIIQQVDSQQVEQMLASDRVPLALAERARWFLRDSRLDRACAGLRQASAANADTAKLAVGLIEHLAPWLEPYAVEVRAESRTGAVLAHAGADAAAQRFSIVKTPTGYTAYAATGELLAGTVPTDSLLQALSLTLSDAQTGALGTPTLDAPALSDLLAEHARTHRDLAAQLIGQAPIGGGVRPPVRWGDGRLGYPLSGRGESRGQASRRGLRQIFPTLGDRQLQNYLLDLIARGVDPWQHYSELSQQLASLRQVLRRWRMEHAGVLDLLRRGRVANSIRRCWRCKTGLRSDGTYALDIRGERVGSLPTLEEGVSFPHVTRLTLRDMDLSEIDPDFLARFPNLRELDLRANHLAVIPPGVERLTELRGLQLDHNRIIMDVAGNRRLSALIRLQTLELNYNPLGFAPDIRGLIHLRPVGLRSTGITSFPSRLQQLPLRGVADLRNNQIRQVNQDLHGLRQRLQRMALHDNPLDEASEQYLNQLSGTSSFRHQLVQVNEREHWLLGSTGAQRSEREMQWRNLQLETTSRPFFNFLRDFARSSDFVQRPNYYRARVWNIIEACEQNTELREQLFIMSGGNASCEDRLLWLFSQMEVRALIHRHTSGMSIAQSEVELMRLSRSLFRLDALDEIATRRIQRIRDAGHDVDDIEVYLTYRVRLAGPLRLPAQPAALHFEAYAGLTPADLNNARVEVLRAETPERLTQALADQAFWERYVRDRYERRFTALVDAFRAPEEAYRERAEAGEVSEEQYLKYCEGIVQAIHDGERDLIVTLAREAFDRWFGIDGVLP